MIGRLVAKLRATSGWAHQRLEARDGSSGENQGRGFKMPTKQRLGRVGNPVYLGAVHFRICLMILIGPMTLT